MQLETQLKTVMITGCSRGLGLCLLKLLSQKDSDKYKFIMAIPKYEDGMQAITDLEKDIPSIRDRTVVRELDVGDFDSITSFIDWVKTDYGKIDCLINNAAIRPDEELSSELVERVFAVNLEGVINLTERMLPCINKNGKILFISDDEATLNKLKSEEIRNEFRSFDKEFNREKFDSLVNRFKTSVQKGTCEKEGWICSAYLMSKLFLNFFSRMLVKNETVTKNDIQVYCCSPGKIDTATYKGSKVNMKSLEEGAKTAMYLIDLDWQINSNYQGCYFEDCKPRSISDVSSTTASSKGMKT